MATKVSTKTLLLGGRFGYSIYFSCSGEGKGESKEPGGGEGRFFIEDPRGGGLPGGRGGGGRGSGRVFAGNGGGG